MESDRRPIAARQLKFSATLANLMLRLHISANAISVFGMIFGVLAGAAFYSSARFPEWSLLAWILAAVFIQLRLLANMLDGMVAIASGKASKVGELYNEVPDRVSDSATLIGLGYAVGGHAILGYGAALAAMATAYVRTMAKAAGAPMDFCGPMAKQHRMFTATIAALVCAAGFRTTFEIPVAALIVILAGSVITFLRRLVRAARALKTK